ncbi:extracellular solute-binding protein [Ensifer canadensis]
MVPIALNYLGLDPYSTKQEDLDKAKDLLLTLRPYIRHMQSGQLVADMASGQLCLAMMWSGDAGIAAARAEEANNGIAVNYSIPREGTIISFDTMAVPGDAPDPEQALAFIDYVLEPKTVADISNHVFLRQRQCCCHAAGRRGDPHGPERLSARGSSRQALRRQVAAATPGARAYPGVDRV